jgi:DNA-binding transcriptional LysR family regulator
MNGMELRHLRYFVTVAEELNVGRAAQRLHISQPPLSRQIQQLEANLNVPLFRREKKRMHLTPVGRAFLSEARSLLEASDRVVRVAQRAARGEVGRLRIGFIDAITTSFLANVLVHFRKKRPDVEIELSELASLAQAEAVQTGRMDVGFVYARPVDLTGLTFDPLLREKLVAAVARSNALSRQARIPLRTFARQLLIIGYRHLNPQLYDSIMVLLRSTGFEPKVAQHTIQFQTTVSLVAAKLGLGLVPSSFAGSRSPGVVYRTVQDLNFPMNMELMWRQKDDSPVVKAFLDTVQSCRDQILQAQNYRRT